MNWITHHARARDAITEALNAGISPSGLRAAQILEHGTMKLYFYEPCGEDKQPTHTNNKALMISMVAILSYKIRDKYDRSISRKQNLKPIKYKSNFKSP